MDQNVLFQNICNSVLHVKTMDTKMFMVSLFGKDLEMGSKNRVFFFVVLDISVLSFPVKLPKDQTFHSPVAKSKESNSKWLERERAPFCKPSFFNF